MNNARRSNLTTLVEQLTRIKEDVDGHKEEEQDYLDNMPENFQDSERYQVGEEAVENMEAASDSIDEAIEFLTAATA